MTPVAVGIDIVYIPRFKTLAAGTLEHIFLPTEFKEAKPEHLAGLMAAKEAFFKALGRKDDWQAVWVEYTPSGKPELRSSLLNPDQQVEVSISHDGDYAIAQVILYNYKNL